MKLAPDIHKSPHATDRRYDASVAVVHIPLEKAESGDGEWVFDKFSNAVLATLEESLNHLKSFLNHL